MANRRSKIAVITGASSEFIRFLINLLRNEGYEIIAITKHKSKVYFEEGITWKICDLSIPGIDFSYLSGADILIHAASVSYAYTNEEYLQNNFTSTVNLVEAAKTFSVKKFVYISSSSAGPKNGYYGISKIKSEDYVKANLKKWLIIRPTQIYGYTNKTTIDKLISNVKNSRIVLYPGRDNKNLCPIYYKDLAQNIFEYLKVEDSNTTKVIYGPEKFTYFELVKTIKDNLNRKILIILIPKILIIIIFWFIKIFKIKVGIYPDQFYRFYNNPSFKSGQTKNISISKYLTFIYRRDTM